jgi:hypothetical protein
VPSAQMQRLAVFGSDNLRTAVRHITCGGSRESSGAQQRPQVTNRGLAGSVSAVIRRAETGSLNPDGTQRLSQRKTQLDLGPAPRRRLHVTAAM